MKSIKSGLGALRKSAQAIREESQLLKEIGQIVESCLKNPHTALQQFSEFMDRRRRERQLGPTEGFVRVEIDGEIVLLSAEEAQQFINEAESGPKNEQRIAAKMKRILTCQPEELFGEAIFIRMLVEATLDQYQQSLVGDDSYEAKELQDLIRSVETRLKRRMSVLQEDHNTLDASERIVANHRRTHGMEDFERLLQDFQQSRDQHKVVEMQRLGQEIQLSRPAYERASKAIQPTVRTCKIARRDIQVHISVFLRYLEALVHKRKEALVSSVAQLRSKVESEGGASTSELVEQEKQLESISQHEEFVSKQARESDAVIAAVTAAENLSPTTPQADVDEIMNKAGVKAMQKKLDVSEKPAEVEAKKRGTGMHVHRDE